MNAFKYQIGIYNFGFSLGSDATDLEGVTQHALGVTFNEALSTRVQTQEATISGLIKVHISLGFCHSSTSTSREYSLIETLASLVLVFLSCFFGVLFEEE